MKQRARRRVQPCRTLATAQRCALLRVFHRASAEIDDSRTASLALFNQARIALEARFLSRTERDAMRDN